MVYWFLYWRINKNWTTVNNCSNSALREGLDVLENSIFKIFNDKNGHTGLVTNNIDKSLFFGLTFRF